jgi:hypothetical protein
MWLSEPYEISDLNCSAFHAAPKTLGKSTMFRALNTEFHPNRLALICNVRVWSDVSGYGRERLCVQNADDEFHENPTDGVPVGNESQVKGRKEGQTDRRTYIKSSVSLR